jgi:glycosidase
VNENYTSINVKEQASNLNSVLQYFKDMVQLRKKHATLIYGDYKPVDENNKQLFAYTRSLDKDQFLIVLNFSDQAAILHSSIESKPENIVISNYETPNKNNEYQPYAAVIYKIK